MSSTIFSAFAVHLVAFAVRCNFILTHITQYVKKKFLVFSAFPCVRVGGWTSVCPPCIHTVDLKPCNVHTHVGGQSGITWQVARPTLTVSSNARSVVSRVSLFRCTHSITYYSICQELFSTDRRPIFSTVSLSCWHNVLYQTCRKMSIVFLKKFSTNFFSVAYMERACARTGTIYTRKKNFGVNLQNVHYVR